MDLQRGWVAVNHVDLVAIEMTRQTCVILNL